MINLLAQDPNSFGFALDASLLPKLVIPLWILSMIAIIVAIVWFVRRRRRLRAGSKREISPSALSRVWSSFLRQIPGEFRRSVLFFQPFVVFGEAGAGKSLLIGKYTDWKGQAAQFYPSYSVDPNLQIYLGSRALVQEIPATLLADTSSMARTALVRLWQPLFRKRQPIVVLTLSAAALRKATPESLRTTAQTVRGKINVLSRLVDKPIQVRVVLTHMDQVEGYLAFSQFVEKQEIPSQIKLDNKILDGGLSTCLEPFETYLPLALTTVPSRSYLKILTFLNKAPETFVNLGILLRTLKENDPLSYEPEVSELFLSSDTSGSPSAVSNPFASSWLDQSLAIQRASRRRHGRVMIAVAVLGLLYLAASFWYARSHLVVATSALERFEKAVHGPKNLDASLAGPTAESISNFARGTDWPIAHALMPSYFSTAPANLRARFVKAIREEYVLPAFRDAATSPSPHEKTLFLLALLYASHDNDLGRFIVEGRRAGEWNKVTGIPTALVEAYVLESEEAWTEPPPFTTLPYERRESPYATPEKWHDLLALAQRRQEEPSIELQELEALQALARSAREGLNALRQSFTSTNIYILLKGNPNFPSGDYAQYISGLTVPAWLMSASQPLDAFLKQIIEESTIKAPQVLGEDLRPPFEALFEGIDAATKRGDKASPGSSDQPATRTVIQIEIPGKPDLPPYYTLDTGRWDAIIIQGRISLLAADFMQQHQNDGDTIFFYKNRSQARDTHAPRSGTDYMFNRPYVVPLEYTNTRAGFLSIQAQLDRMRKLATELKLNETPWFGKFSDTMRAACDDYGTKYARHWREYYLSWNVDAKSYVKLRAVLNQMRQPVSSIFQEFLAQVRRNTRLKRSVAPYIEIAGEDVILSKLDVFQPVNALFPEDVAFVGSNVDVQKEAARNAAKSQLPEFEKYRILLDRLLSDLEAKESLPQAEEPKEMQRTPVEFTQLLSPVGRLSYAILRETRDSYRIQVEEWLKSEGIGDEWGAPFREPIRQLHVLGVQDIQTVIQNNWERRVLSQAVPLLDKFPFSRVSTTDATPRDVEQVLFPTTGFFWTTWRNLIAPVCVEDHGTWGPMRGLQKDFVWPAKMFDTTNALARITNALWNRENRNPQPLTLTIKPEGLPPPSGKHDRPEIILGFLNSGKNSVFAFNQKEAKVGQKLSIEWWLRPNAQVGIQVGDPDTGAKSFRAVTEPDSAWSFYHLLLRDRQAERTVQVFNLTQGEPEYPVPILKFTFQDDPWEIWSVPTSRNERGTENEGK